MMRSFRNNPQLNKAINEQEHVERQRALVGLLRYPLMLPSGKTADLFLLVRRHADWLRGWLIKYPNWSLRIDRQCARLRKHPVCLNDPTRGAVDTKSASRFTRQQYALLCLALIAIEQSDKQTTLGQIADRIVGLVAHDEKFSELNFYFDLKTQDQRMDIVHAMRLLVELGVLTLIDGDEKGYIHNKGDVLYTINRDAATSLPCTRQGPSSIETNVFDAYLQDLTFEPHVDSDEGRNQRCRTSLYRRLLDDPVVYFDDLDPDEKEYLTSQRPRLIEVIEKATGLIAEIRAEGIAMVDETGTATDLGLPEEGTYGHVTLLFAEFLANHLRSHGAASISRSKLEIHASQLIQEHHKRWRKDATEPGAEVTLVDEVIKKLRALRLISHSSHGITPRPAIARYALAAPEESNSSILFETEKQFDATTI